MPLLKDNPIFDTEGREAVTVGEIKIGDTFTHFGSFGAWQKTDLCSAEGHSYCVALGTGTACTFVSDEEATPIDLDAVRARPEEEEETP